MAVHNQEYPAMVSIIDFLGLEAKIHIRHIKQLIIEHGKAINNPPTQKANVYEQMSKIYDYTKRQTKLVLAVAELGIGDQSLDIIPHYELVMRSSARALSRLMWVINIQAQHKMRPKLSDVEEMSLREDTGGLPSYLRHTPASVNRCTSHNIEAHYMVIGKLGCLLLLQQ